MRAKVEKKMAERQKEEKEERLREMALHARADRAGIRATGNRLNHSVAIDRFDSHLCSQIRMMITALNEIRFDKNVIKSGNVLQLCKEQAAINGNILPICKSIMFRIQWFALIYVY
jgi:hypothetical protein